MLIRQYEWNYGGMEADPCGEYVRFEDHQAVAGLVMETIGKFKAEAKSIDDELQRLREPNTRLRIDTLVGRLEDSAWRALFAERDRLRAGLEAVEWDLDGCCVWCKRANPALKGRGHSPDCQRQVALGKV